MTTDEQLPVFTYIRRSLHAIDGRTWAGLCFLTFLCAIDLIFDLKLIPLREVAKPGKAAVLLAFTPLLLFLILVVLRQLPFASNAIANWLRAAVCIAVFMIINF